MAMHTMLINKPPDAGMGLGNVNNICQLKGYFIDKESIAMCSLILSYLISPYLSILFDINIAPHTVPLSFNFIT